MPWKFPSQLHKCLFIFYILRIRLWDSAFKRQAFIALLYDLVQFFFSSILFVYLEWKRELKILQKEFPLVVILGILWIDGIYGLLKRNKTLGNQMYCMYVRSYKKTHCRIVPNNVESLILNSMQSRYKTDNLIIKSLCFDLGFWYNP